MLNPEITIHWGRAARKPASIQRTLCVGVIDHQPTKPPARRQRLLVVGADD
jgi:hypothetical protein